MIAIGERETVRALKAWRREHRHVPTRREWDESGASPCSATIAKRHGDSWAEALRAAGMKPHEQTYWTERRIIAALKRYARRTGRPPRAKAWRQARKTRPSTQTVQERMGSWSAACRAAGLTPRRPGQREAPR